MLKPRIRKGKGSRSKAVASIRRSESAMSMASTTSADSADSADSEASGESSDSAQQHRRRRQRRVHGHAEDSDEEELQGGATLVREVYEGGPTWVHEQGKDYVYRRRETPGGQALLEPRFARETRRL